MFSRLRSLSFASLKSNLFINNMHINLHLFPIQKDNYERFLFLECMSFTQ